MQLRGEGDGTPLQYSCLENSMDGGAWQAAVHGVAKSWTQLSDFTFTQRNLAVCSPWGHRESDTTERLSTHTHTQAVYIALPVFTGYVIFIIKLFFF